MTAAGRRGLPPRVGVGLFLLDAAGRFPLMRRAGSHGAGRWGLPGGAMEPGEDPEDTALREAAEELGVTLERSGIVRGPYVNGQADDGGHWLTLFCAARLPEGREPHIMEPDKCVGLGRFPLGGMPDPLFGPMAAFVAEGLEIPRPAAPPGRPHWRRRAHEAAWPAFRRLVATVPREMSAYADAYEVETGVAADRVDPEASPCFSAWCRWKALRRAQALTRRIDASTFGDDGGTFTVWAVPGPSGDVPAGAKWRLLGEARGGNRGRCAAPRTSSASTGRARWRRASRKGRATTTWC